MAFLLSKTVCETIGDIHCSQILNDDHFIYGDPQPFPKISVFVPSVPGNIFLVHIRDIDNYYQNHTDFVPQILLRSHVDKNIFSYYSFNPPTSI